MVSTKLVTAEELSTMGSDAPYDLIDGRLYDAPLPAFGASVIGTSLGGRVAAYVHDQELGILTGAGGGYLFRRDPDTVVAPDIAFVSEERIPSEMDLDCYFPGAPDLAVEVIFTADARDEAERRLAVYADANVRLTWVLDAMARVVTVHRPGEPPIRLVDGDILTGGDVLPGFEYAVAEIFKLLRRN